VLKCCEIGESMQDLASIRVRHSMLSGVYVQIKNYLDCVDRDYLGKMNQSEQTLVDEMKNFNKSMEKMLREYFHKEEKILNGD
jgi:hypothetical protein